MCSFVAYLLNRHLLEMFLPGIRLALPQVLKPEGLYFLLQRTRSFLLFLYPLSVSNLVPHGAGTACQTRRPLHMLLRPGGI